ncbi:MAG TPA: sensor histidine kinase, partial [Thermoanaerobaculia bacterium]|nr:sensor histidine kinase [Thermoanaerobaculia bacterium]
LNSHHRDMETTLRRLRGDVHLSGIYIRDFLLDTDRAETPQYRQRLTELRQAHASNVKRLRQLLPRSAAPQIDTLETRLDEYWHAFEPLFEWSPYEKLMLSGRFLRRDVLPRREAVLAMTGDIEKLNNSNLAAQRAEVSRRLAGFREDLERSLWRTLLIGALVAFVAVIRLRMLERRSAAQRRQLVAAQEEERKKLTRELHDHVGQMLTALRMEISRADRVAEAKRLLDMILRSVRDLAMGLRPSMLDDFGLQPALEWHVRDFRRRFGIPVDLVLRGDVDALSEPYRTCIYRIVQEALTNCARHAQAKQVHIAMSVGGGTLDLIVADDGIGIARTFTRGVGLLGIEERVRELSGTFAVRRRERGGTELRVSMPTREMEVPLARAAG